jgi:hypothetical protein
MKKSLFLLAVGIYSLTANAQNKSNTEPYQTKSLAGQSITNVEVKTSGGSISVMGGSTSDARIEVYVNANNNGDKNLSKEELTKRLQEDYNLDISVANNKLAATAQPKDRNMNWKKSLSISFKVYAAQNMNTKLATSGGSISLKNLAGSQDFSTSGGSLSLDGLSGQVNGRTSGGSINVTNSKDELDLSTSGGSINADNCTGNLKLNTSGGSLKLSQLNGTIKAHTSGGSINGNNISGELSTHTSGGSIKLSDMMCSLETSTSGGHIDVAIKQYGKYIKINNSGGNIDLQIPKNKGIDIDLSARKVNAGTVENFKGVMNDDEIKGKLNGGGIPVTVNAGSGRITLTMN